MNISNLLNEFYLGRITLWKSYWIIGELINAIFIVILLNIELYFFKNNQIVLNIPMFYFNNLHIINKLLLFVWTIFLTVGIWRSAENYKGNIFWLILTLLILSYRLFTLRLIFFN